MTPSDGPELMRAPDGTEVLRYMYAHFVFTWPKGSSRVTIEHGKLNGKGNWRMPKEWAFTIEEPWTRETLAAAGRQWYAEHCARFARHR